MTNRSLQGIAVGSRWRGFSYPHRVLCALLASLQLLLPSLVAALPSDGNVVGGNAEIQQISPTQLTIQQTTDKAILNWQSFSIGADEVVRFVQPSINSIALNRVTGVDPSVILGSLQANGRIFLLNPNGILFGAGAQIDVGGLLATTLQIRDEDFMAGRYFFAQDQLKGLKSVVNQGTIHVSDHGFVVLAAPGVSNEGMIVANLGTTVLASGKTVTVDLMGDGLINYAISGKVLDQVMGVDGKPLSSAVSNTGTIQADGGHIILQAKASGDIFSSVVNQSGVIRARSLVNQEGVVLLDGGDSGLVQVAGDLDASGLSIEQKGGQVSVLGRSVELRDTTNINVSGNVGGGRVLVGGNYQGQGPEPNAISTLVAAGASINADAISQGDGGTVIVWADGHTGYGGSISAKGGQSGGNGGFVEVSGKNTLGFSGRVDTSAPVGRTGTLLLDPSDITISNLANGNISAGPTFTGTALTSNLNVTTLQTALGTNNVIVDTTSPFLSAGNITVSNAVTWASANSLDLRAHNNITVNAGISSTGLGILRLIGNQDGIGGGNVAVNAAISSRLGGIQLSGVGVTSNVAGTITTTGLANGNGGNLTIIATGSVNLAGTVTATGGAAAAGNPGRNGGIVSITGATGVTTGTVIASGSNGGAGNTAGGNAGTITITNTTSGNLTTGTLTARTGNAVGTGAGGTAGSITVTQSNAVAGAFLQTGTINTSGGTKGAGGAVQLNSASNVNAASTITASGGSAVAGGTHAGAAAGNVTITGVNRTVGGAITASGGAAIGTNQAGGNAGVVSSTGAGFSTTGAVNARTGAATGTGAGGTAGSVTLSGTTVSSGAINTSGLANGVGGNVTVTSTTGATTLTGAMTTSGGTANAGTSGRQAGAVSVTSAGNATTTTITVSGSNGNGAGQAGGGGANVIVSSTGGNVTVGAISTIGGSGLAGNANGGTGGAVTLDAGGATPMITHRNITTTGGNRFGSGTAGTGGAISIADAALLSANTTLTATGGSAGLGTGGSVTFGSTVNGNAAGRTLAVNSNGTTTFTGEVGGTQALGSLTTNATGTVQIGGNVTTTGVQTYGDPVTLIGNSIMTGTTPTFGSTVAGGGFNLTLNFSGATIINGVNFTGINNFASGNGGTTNLTGAFSTAGAQTYNDAVVLTGATTVTSSGNQAVTFNNSVNGAQALVVNTAGTTTFGGAVGGTTALTSMTTNAGGTTAINGGVVSTSGAQTYNDVVTLGANTTLTGTTPTFGSTVMGGGFDLALNFSGATTINGANLIGINNFSSSNGGTTQLTGAFTTSGSQTYTDAVSLIGATTVDSSGNQIIAFNNIVNGAQTLAVNTTGTTTFGGAVGGTTALTSLTTDTGGTTVINGGSVMTTGAQTYNDAVTLGAATALISNAGGNIALNGATNGAQSLTLNAGTGNIVMNGIVGGFTPLTSLTVVNAGNVTFGNNVMTTGDLLQSAGTGTTTLNGAMVGGGLTLTTDSIILATTPISVTGGPISLTAANTINQNSNLTIGGANAVTIIATGGPIAMAGTATTTSGTGAISYTAGTNVTLGSLDTGGAVNVIANGGSIFSAAGSSTNVTAGAALTLQAFNGVVGTQAAPITVIVNPGTLSIRATIAVAGISAFLTGTVLPSNALTLLNVPPGLVCFNACLVSPSNNPVGSFFGLIPSFNRESAIPWYLRGPSDPPLISIVSTYIPGTVVVEAQTDVKLSDQSVAREIPPCYPESACNPGASILTAPADGEDPELFTAK
ncbi:MAG: filamentous hemagglutinin N-terminal domain-containing protein [Nitrospirota bacterium]|mgnify:FL=1